LVRSNREVLIFVTHLTEELVRVRDFLGKTHVSFLEFLHGEIISVLRGYALLALITALRPA